MAREAKKDFFISYRGADQRWALWIDSVVKEAGYTTMIQAVDFTAGDDFILRMDEGLKTCHYTMPVYTPRYFESPFTAAEWSAALKQQIETGEARLLPVCVEKCPIEGLLSSIAYVDLSGLDETAAKTKLLAEIPRMEKKPCPAVVFPGKTEEAPAAKPPFPPDLPPIWNVPHLRNPNFTGRKDSLTRLHDILSSGDTAALTALHGLGGVGKTQIALEYVYRFASDYSLVWWLRSENPISLAADFSALAAPLGLPEKDERDQNLIIAAVLRKLAESGSSLLVFDNAPSRDAVLPYFPHGRSGRVLITSRAANWGDTAQPVNVDVLDENEAIAFLGKRIPSIDDDSAKTLAEELGRLPLALEQAAAFIEATGISPATYLKRLAKEKTALLKRAAPPRDYPHTVATTWDISFRDITKECPPATDLLNLFAFLAPDNIPESLLRAGRKSLPSRLKRAAENDQSFDAVRAALRRYSLAKVEAEFFSVHRLVQSVLRDHLSTRDRKKWATAAIQIVSRVLPAVCSDVRAWPTVAPLLPHGASAAAHAQSLACDADATAYVLNQLALYLQARADYNRANDYLERALRIDEAAFGPDHPSVARDVNNLGSVLKALGDLPAAKPRFERALRIDETAFGPDHPNVARDVGNLGGVLQHLGDFVGAHACYERALAIDEAAFGPDHPNVAIRVNNLGSVLQDLGDLEGAKKLYERALRIDEAAFGPDHPNVAIRVNNLGSVLKAFGDFEGAKKSFERALRVDEAAFGPDHPEVARDVNNLGSVLRDLGDLEGARKCYERALRILTDRLGANHPKTIFVRGNLDSLGK